MVFIMKGLVGIGYDDYTRNQLRHSKQLYDGDIEYISVDSKDDRCPKSPDGKKSMLNILIPQRNQ